jgi:hypothetical protein
VASKAPVKAKPSPAVLELAKALIEYADGKRAEPPSLRGVGGEELYLAIRALGRDPVEVARKARERWGAQGAPPQPPPSAPPSAPEAAGAGRPRAGAGGAEGRSSRELVEAALREAEAYYWQQGTPLTLRGLFYILVSKNLIAVSRR